MFAVAYIIIDLKGELVMNTLLMRRARLAAAQVAAVSDGLDPSSTAISDLRLWRLREPASRRVYSVVRIRTKGGTVGFGESGHVPSEEIVRGTQIIQGKAATSYEVLDRQLTVTPNLQPAINMALLDIVGKLAKAPLYQVLGGPTRHKARVMTTLEGATDAELVASLRRNAEAGYRAFIVPLPAAQWRNNGRQFAKAVMDRLDTLRSAGGDNADFVLDAAGRLTAGDAGVIAAAVEHSHLLWFDEPTPEWNRKVASRASQETVTPIGFGRTTRAGDFQELLREQAIDILRPSVHQHGISKLRRLAAVAEPYYTAIAPFHEGGPIATVAALHMAASVPNFFIQQIPAATNEKDKAMREHILRRPEVTLKDGFTSLPSGPGLGIQVDEDALPRYEERPA